MAKTIIENITEATSSTVPVGITHSRKAQLAVHVKSTAGTVATLLVLTSDNKVDWNQVAKITLPDTTNEFDASVSGGALENLSEHIGFAVPSITGTIERISVAGLE